MNIQLENGERQTVLMGCYGIGTTRLVGTIVEASHDDAGMIWPKSVAPFHVEIVSLRAKDTQMNVRVLERAQGLYEELTRAGVEVLWDDRDTSPGEKFADADLIGIPLRLSDNDSCVQENSICFCT
jgi:prolyl-tRNA synthetase